MSLLDDPFYIFFLSPSLVEQPKKEAKAWLADEKRKLFLLSTHIFTIC